MEMATNRPVTITPKSMAQKGYIDAIRNYDVVFGVGPAGTGKTYLAECLAGEADAACRNIGQSCGATVSENTGGDGNNFNPSCDGDGNCSNDVEWWFQAPEAGVYRLDTGNTGTGPIVYHYRNFNLEGDLTGSPTLTTTSGSKVRSAS